MIAFGSLRAVRPLTLALLILLVILIAGTAVVQLTTR